jgi:hypothetical protein
MTCYVSGPHLQGWLTAALLLTTRRSSRMNNLCVCRWRRRFLLLVLSQHDVQTMTPLDKTCTLHPRCKPWYQACQPSINHQSVLRCGSRWLQKAAMSWRHRSVRTLPVASKQLKLQNAGWRCFHCLLSCCARLPALTVPTLRTEAEHARMSRNSSEGKSQRVEYAATCIVVTRAHELVDVTSMPDFYGRHCA